MHLNLFILRYVSSAIIFLELLFAPIALSPGHYVQYDYFRQLLLFLPSLYFGFVSGIIKFHHVNSRFSLDYPFFVLLGVFGAGTALFFYNVVLGLATAAMIFILSLEKVLILEDRFLQASMLKAVISIITLGFLVFAWLGLMFVDRPEASLFGTESIPLLASIVALAVMLFGFRNTAKRYIGKVGGTAAVADLVHVCKLGLPLSFQTMLLNFVLVSSRDLAIGVSESFAFNFALSLNLLQFTIVGMNTLAFTNQKTLTQDISKNYLHRQLVIGFLIMLGLFVLNLGLFVGYNWLFSMSDLHMAQFMLIGLPAALFFYASAFSMFNYYRSNGFGLLVIHALMALGILGLRYLLDYERWQVFYFGLGGIFLIGATGIFYLVLTSQNKI